MAERQYSADEMMTVAAARMLRDRVVCFVGIGLPSAAANLARLTHAPEAVLIYESGTIGAKPTCRSRSATEIGRTADTVVSIAKFSPTGCKMPRRRRFPGRSTARSIGSPISAPPWSGLPLATGAIAGAGRCGKEIAYSARGVDVLRQSKRAFVANWTSSPR
jgi:glutaconate CoA-transferase subunit B